MAKKFVVFCEAYDVIGPLDYSVFNSLEDANRDACLWAMDLNDNHHEGRVWVASCEEKDLNKYLELLKTEEIDPVVQDDFYADHFDSNRHFFDSDDDFCQKFCLAKDAEDHLTSILIKHDFRPYSCICNDLFDDTQSDVTKLKSTLESCTFSLGEGSLGLLLDYPLETAVERATVVGVENEFLFNYLNDVRPSFDEERKWFNEANTDDKWYFSLEELKENMAGEVDFDLLDPQKVSDQTVAEYIANLELDHGIRINADFDPNSDYYEEYFYIDHSNPDYLTICSAPYSKVYDEVDHLDQAYNEWFVDTLQNSPEELGVDPNSEEYKHFSELVDLPFVDTNFTGNPVLDAKDEDDYRDLDELYKKHAFTRYDKIVKTIMEGIKAEYEKELVQEGLTDVNQQEQKQSKSRGR